MYVKVLVQARAKREQIEVHGTALTIAVREPARQNRANARVCALVAQHFGVAEKSVRIISGHHSPSKMLSVAEVPE